MGTKLKKVFKDSLVWWLIIAVEFWFLMIWEPGSGGRKSIHEYYVYEAYRASPRTVAWLDYADDLDYWFIEKDNAACSFSDAGGFLRKPDVYVYTVDLDDGEWKSMFEWCLPHEVGHYIDSELGDISGTEEFQEAVELSIIMWENLPPGVEVKWFHTAEGMARFAGVNGNPLPEGAWGGYKELYANLHDVDHIEEIPPPLRSYFEEFLP
jgi:hypothetical protein